MTEKLIFALRFDKFLSTAIPVGLGPGLHVFYGESGVGKSSLLHQLAGSQSSPHRDNFELEINHVPSPVQVILQNPDQQIVRPTISGELAFGIECIEHDPRQIAKRLETMDAPRFFPTDYSRHPATLSGGEKELLNLITAFHADARTIFIDDGLSFLNLEKKQMAVRFIREQIQQYGMIVVWGTSDPDDGEFGDTGWQLSLSALTRKGESHRPDYPKPDFPSGTLGIDGDHLTFGYAKEHPVFRNFSIQMNSVRSLGIIGDNGCGKSTLAQLLLGILTPEKGRISLTLGSSTPMQMGYLDQFPERMLGVETPHQFVQRLLDAGFLLDSRLENVQQILLKHQINWELIRDIPAYDIPWSTLRMTLILVLTNCRYDVLILDEPTFGLGWQQRLILFRYLHRILQHKHLVIISHDRNFIQGMCDRILNLNELPETIKQSPKFDQQKK